MFAFWCLAEIIVVCPKFGKPALISEFYDYALDKEFVAAVGMLRKNYVFNGQVNVRTLDRVSEIRACLTLVNEINIFIDFKLARILSSVKKVTFFFPIIFFI